MKHTTTHCIESETEDIYAYCDYGLNTISLKVEDSDLMISWEQARELIKVLKLLDKCTG